MKIDKVIFLICSLYYSSTFAQETVLTDQGNANIEKISFSTNKKNDYILKNKIRLNKSIVEIICHPSINSIKYENFTSDSTDNVLVKSSDVIIFLKNSFSWNIEEGLPVVPKESVIKSLLKRKETLTEDEWKIINYMVFYTQGYNSMYVEKFECIQEIEVNQQDRFKIKYEVKYDCQEKLNIVNKTIEKIEVTNAIST